MDDGLIILNKPPGITSAKALYRVRKTTRVRKSGHAGTLDPLADGVLILCLGKATKLTELLMDQPKVYSAGARLDATSPTLDADGPLEPVETACIPDETTLRAVLREFEGCIEQIPPAISAIKVDGTPAYKLARAGRRVELKARPVTVYWLHLERFQWPELDFQVACGRGTYVRSLIRDSGTRLHAGGYLTRLTRLRVGPFELRRAVTFEQLESAADWREHLIPLDEARRLLTKRPITIPSRPAS